MRKRIFWGMLAVTILIGNGCAPVITVQEISANRYTILVEAGQGYNARSKAGYGTEQLYTEWEKKAGQICNDNYRVVDRQFIERSIYHLPQVVGTIACR